MKARFTFPFLIFLMIILILGRGLTHHSNQIPSSLLNKPAPDFILQPLHRSSPAHDYYPFDSHLQEQRFILLTHQFRCLVCQNQTLADSNTALAADLREQIYHHLQQGQSDSQVIQYLVNRYGNFILYRPPLNISTIALWFGPFLIFLGALWYLINYLEMKKAPYL